MKGSDCRCALSREHDSFNQGTNCRAAIKMRVPLPHSTAHTRVQRPPEIHSSSAFEQFVPTQASTRTAIIIQNVYPIRLSRSIRLSQQSRPRHDVRISSQIRSAMYRNAQRQEGKETRRDHKGQVPLQEGPGRTPGKDCSHLVSRWLVS
jgi:hypothetical protein